MARLIPGLQPERDIVDKEASGKSAALLFCRKHFAPLCPRTTCGCLWIVPGGDYI